MTTETKIRTSNEALSASRGPAAQNSAMIEEVARISRTDLWCLRCTTSIFPASIRKR